MSSVVITSNKISNTGVAVTVHGDESLQIAPGVLVAGDDGFNAVALSGGMAAGQILVEGYIDGGDDGIDFQEYSTGDELISVGASGSVVASETAINLSISDASNTLYTQIVDNDGYVFGGVYGVELVDAPAQITNSGHISGGIDGIYLRNDDGDTIVNETSGVISGPTAILAEGEQQSILNAGEITSTSTSSGLALGIESNLVNSGHIQGVDNTVYFEGGYDSVQNSGTIAARGSSAIQAQGDNVTIQNSGVISAMSDAIYLNGTSGLDWIVNQSGGLIEAQDTNYAIFVDGDAAHIVNHGDIGGSIFAGGSSTFVNTGDYDGDAVLSGGNVLVRNTGHMTFDGYSGVVAAVAGVKCDITEVSGENVYIGGGAGDDDRLVNAAGGVIDDPDAIAIYHDAEGTFGLTNSGDIYGDIDLYGQSTVYNSGTLGGGLNFFDDSSVFVNQGIVDGDVTFTGTGNLYRGLTGEVTGTIYGAGADGRYYGGSGDDTFDMTASGAQYVSGGAGDDTFVFTAAGLTAKTWVLGGAGNDTLTFSTSGAIVASAIAHVSGIETINLDANSLILTDALVSSATDDKVTVNGGAGVDTIYDNRLTSSAETVAIFGGGGGDVITAGAAKDIFGYNQIADSSGTNYDKISGANFNVDRFDVSAAVGSVLAINTAVTTGTLSNSTFATDLANDLPAAKLGAHDAVLFTASAGTLSGQTFLVVDSSANAGYKAGYDLVINLTGTAGNLTTADFI